MATNLDELSVNDLLKRMNNEDKTVPLIVEEALPQINQVIEQVIATIKTGGKIVYMGSGTSGRLGILDASECPPTFGVSPDLFSSLIAGGQKAIQTAVEDAEDNTEAGRIDVKQAMTEKDLLITISASGRTPYVIGGISKAKELGAKTVGIVCAGNSKISSLVDYPIELIVGEEIIRGSSRLKAGTAQKLVLNMISSISMIKLGKVYQNYMVDVQASNKKLRNRIVNIVADIANVDKDIAKMALQQTNGDLKAAVLVSKFKIDKLLVNDILNDNDQNLRVAMDQLESKIKLNKQSKDE